MSNDSETEIEDVETEITPEESFSKGFSNVNGGDDAPPENAGESADNAQDAEETPNTDDQGDIVAEETAKDDQQLGDLETSDKENTEDPNEVIKRLKLDKRRLEGKIGELSMNQPAAQPVVDEVKQPTELKNPTAMSALNKEFPEVSPVTEELTATNARLDETNQAMDRMRIDLREEMSRDSQLTAFEVRHPDGLALTKKDEFRDWSIEGGPPIDDYLEMKGLEKSAADDRYSDSLRVMFDRRAKTTIESWQHIHPQWWASKGNGLFSESAVDASVLLDDYKSHISTLSSQSNEQDRRHKRIKGAVTPTGSGNPPQKGISDDESFSIGFARANRH